MSDGSGDDSTANPLSHAQRTAERPSADDASGRRRRSIRLRGYDYGQPGAYFVTVVTAGRRWMFGEVAGGVMRLTDAGKIVRAVWDELPQHYSHVALDAFVVMPNHIHGIILLESTPEHGGPSSDHLSDSPASIPPRHPLPEIVRAFKSFTSRRINVLHGTPGLAVWQRNYYEHVIRGEESLDRIRRYVEENPARWDEDREGGGGAGEGEGGSETRPYRDVGRGVAGREGWSAGGRPQGDDGQGCS